MRKSKLRPWEVVDTRQIFSAEPWFSILRQQVRLPDGTLVENYHQIRLPEYVVVFAQARDGKVIIERQYKHGVGKVTLTLPAGSVEQGEAPLEAAKRELAEETGYRSDNWRSLGAFYNHGSYGCGRGHLFMAHDALQVADPESGDLEDMEIILMEPWEIVNCIRTGDVALMGTMATIALATNPLFLALAVDRAQV